MNLDAFLATLQPIELRTPRLADDALAGGHPSARRGRGTDFDALRAYTPGDDVRDIDWKVTSRMGRPFVRVHREEREFGVVLLVDVSASSAFGSGAHSKRRFAAEVAATLAVSAARRGTKVGLLLFTDRVELQLPPRKGRAHLLRVVRELFEFEPKGWGTDLAVALAVLNHTLRRRSLVCLVSDFLPDSPDTATADTRDRFARELGQARVRHDVVCLQVHDPREAFLPDAGVLTLEDAETGELVEVFSGDPEVRESYGRRQARRLAELDEALVHAGIDHLRLPTDEPCGPALTRFFESRGGRRHP